ncbi:VPS9b-like protein [Elsinoe fawcettii]|nr:VPS9b-like protein [Elsinoe fawcettii]
MSTPSAAKSQRPRVQTTRSFQRFESAPNDPMSPNRTRANTVHTPTITLVPEARQLSLSPEDHGKVKTGDIFEASQQHDDSVEAPDSQAGKPQKPQVETLEQLPIEIRSFADRFLKSLSVKSHAAPLTIDSIADLFQDFYIQAESHISTHIAALTTRLSRDNLRDKSPAPSIASRSSISSKGPQRGGSIDADDGGEQQMLTASEITGKRKARRMLELQRGALEEAVERGVCEKVYDKLYRHRSTDDEEKDAKLRSKTAALSLVGIGLKELHVNIPEAKDGGEEEQLKLQEEMYTRLSSARESLQKMDQERYPLGKLHHLTMAHQGIVETLAHIFPSTSSADEVLPTLIYTLITSPPESLNVVSNLHFIQLFRAANRVDGEAAYCLVNLEAAISFLETVDLSSLRTEDLANRSADVVGVSSTVDGQGIKSLTADLPAVSNPDQKTSDDRASPVPDSPARATRPFQTNQRRISHMLQAQAERIEASRENFINSADQAFDSINSTLENSFKFLFGRLKEQEKDSHNSPVIIPKTLDDARRLVKSPIQEEDEELLASSQVSLNAAVADDPLQRSDDKVLGLVAGRRPPREQSVDSNKSGGSNKRSSFFGGDDKTPQGPAEAVGNFVNSLNPLTRFGVGVPSFPKFGRSASGQVPDQMMAEKPLSSPTQKHARQGSGQANQAEVDLNAVEALAQLRKAKPPVKRFMEVKDAKELKVGEIEDLLKDYRRLAGLLGDAITS